MSDRSKIEWTDSTWNPMRGCSRISEGCRNCYAERMAARFCGGGETDQSGEVILSAGPFFGFARQNPARWTGRVELIEDQMDIPLHWKKPRRIFVNSMSDTFHESLPYTDIKEVIMTACACPQHTFMVLTKRANRMRDVVTQIYRECDKCELDCETAADCAGRFYTTGPASPFENLWLGVSVESRAELWRIDDLRRTPAAIRFLSLEPLLEDLGTINLEGIGWVIVGSESGLGARPMNEKWVRSIRDQCLSAGVPFFYKQRLDGGKKISLPGLDGRTWNQFPEVKR